MVVSEKNTHTIILFHIFYDLRSDKVQIDDERHKGNQRINNSNYNQHSKCLVNKNEPYLIFTAPYPSRR